jgi:hypothetical protein
MPATSLTLCPKCGGVIDAPPAASLAGHSLCGCAGREHKRDGSRSSTSSFNRVGLDSRALNQYASELAASGKQKFCCVCGMDVTHAQRMKDAGTGRYWCTECGANQPQHQQHAMDMPCPQCHKPVAALRLMKLDDRYVCPACYAKHAGPGAAGRLSVLFVLGIVLLGLIVYGLFVLKLI